MTGPVHQISHQALSDVKHFCVLPGVLFEEFDRELTKLEAQFSMQRANVLYVKGNTFGMQGDTWFFYYLKTGKQKTFSKSLRHFWHEFNQLHPETAWRGK